LKTFITFSFLLLALNVVFLKSPTLMKGGGGSAQRERGTTAILSGTSKKWKQDCSREVENWTDFDSIAAAIDMEEGQKARDTKIYGGVIALNLPH